MEAKWRTEGRLVDGPDGAVIFLFSDDRQVAWRESDGRLTRFAQRVVGRRAARRLLRSATELPEDVRRRVMEALANGDPVAPEDAGAAAMLRQRSLDAPESVGVMNVRDPADTYAAADTADTLDRLPEAVDPKRRDLTRAVLDVARVRADWNAAAITRRLQADGVKVSEPTVRRVMAEVARILEDF